MLFLLAWVAYAFISSGWCISCRQIPGMAPIHRSFTNWWMRWFMLTADRGEPSDKVERLTTRLFDRFQPHTVYKLSGGQHLPSSLDFVIIDGGGHEKLAAQIEALWPRLHPRSVLVLSGFHRHDNAKALWRSIKAKPNVTVTIDLFWVGLVFFHSGQCKEDFKIRF